MTVHDRCVRGARDSRAPGGNKPPSPGVCQQRRNANKHSSELLQVAAPPTLRLPPLAFAVHSLACLYTPPSQRISTCGGQNTARTAHSFDCHRPLCSPTTLMSMPSHRRRALTHSSHAPALQQLLRTHLHHGCPTGPPTLTCLAAASAAAAAAVQSLASTTTTTTAAVATQHAKPTTL